jgi:DNA repair exonuclease SbcCD nuclease subunit
MCDWSKRWCLWCIISDFNQENPHYMWGFLFNSKNNYMTVFLGDVHGSFRSMCYHIEMYNLKDCNIVQVGDLGLGFNSLKADLSNLKTLNDFMIEKNIHFYSIRGNHDDPEFWYGININHSNVHLVKDYEILELDDQRILVCGGGISIDRSYREQTRTYFKDEEFHLNMDKIKLITDLEERVDVVVTHNAPHFFHPFGINSRLVDEYHDYEKEAWGTNLKSDLLKERKDIEVFHDEILEKFDVKLWVYGHFHSSNVTQHTHTRTDGKEITTKHVLLDIMEFKKIDFVTTKEEENNDKNIS